MVNQNELLLILQDAVINYEQYKEKMTINEWINNYLKTNLRDKTVNDINFISSELLSTINILNNDKANLDIAIQNSESAESWFTKEVTVDAANNNIEKAYLAVDLINGIAEANASYDNHFEENDSPLVEFDDQQEDKWNDYRLKDALKTVAIEAGKAGMREIASTAYIKATEEGITNVLKDTGFIYNTIEKGSITGLKAAVSAGLTIAQNKGILPTSSIDIIATTAHKTIENFVVFHDVINGKKTITEALIEVKNTAIAAFRSLWKIHGNNLKETVSNAFGIKGAIISGLVTGLLTPAQEGSKLLHVVKETGKAVASFMTRNIAKVSKVFNVIKNLF